MKRSKDNRKISLSDFYCTRCGNKGIPIFRNSGQERPPGHLKKLYCLHCGEEVNMAEISTTGKYTLDDFLIEFNYGNFDEDGNRKELWKQFVSKIRQEMMLNEE